MQRVLLAAMVAAAACLLVAAELSTLYHVQVGTLRTSRDTVSGAEHHSGALFVMAAAAALLGVLAVLRPEDRRWSRGVLALGVAVLAMTLIGDLPAPSAADVREAEAYRDVEILTGPALWLELAGGASLLLAGARPALTRRRADLQCGQAWTS